MVAITGVPALRKAEGGFSSQTPDASQGRFLISRKLPTRSARRELSVSGIQRFVDRLEKSIKSTYARLHINIETSISERMGPNALNLEN